MAPELKFRLATIQDAETLLLWRNDLATRRASHNTEKVEVESHVVWLNEVLQNPERRLFIAEEDEVPVGTVRADFSMGAWDLSWTVAPCARGKGVAKKMVAEIASRIKDPIRAEVKIDNLGSAKIAENAGMRVVKQVEGILHFERTGTDSVQA